MEEASAIEEAGFQESERFVQIQQQSSWRIVFFLFPDGLAYEGGGSRVYQGLMEALRTQGSLDSKRVGVEWRIVEKRSTRSRGSLGTSVGSAP